MNVWNEWRHPVCELGDRDLQGQDWAGATHARKDDLGVQMTSGWLGHSKGAWRISVLCLLS